MRGAGDEGGLFPEYLHDKMGHVCVCVWQTVHNLSIERWAGHKR